MNKILSVSPKEMNRYSFFPHSIYWGCQSWADTRAIMVIFVLMASRISSKNTIKQPERQANVQLFSQVPKVVSEGCAGCKDQGFFKMTKQISLAPSTQLALQHQYPGWFMLEIYVNEISMRNRIGQSHSKPFPKTLFWKGWSHQSYVEMQWHWASGFLLWLPGDKADPGLPFMIFSVSSTHFFSCCVRRILI